ncbi:hypothetical protein ACEN2I_14765 [Flavobacterium sp. W22_SRS_FK3]|uniref:hypothetical protein n=1 Tax=Flavobacterium sp. W22_SRS_FK3 TaxID=3240275 RepID=UPI003F8F9944
MKKFLKQVKENFISGTLLIIPLFVLFLFLEKIWGFFQNYGEKVSILIGLDKVFGTIATDIMGGIILLILLYFSGFLVRLAFMQNLSNWIDNQLMIYIPGYEKHKKDAETKLLKKPPLTSTESPPAPVYPAILLKFGDHWQPAYLVEENDGDEVVVFVPAVPSKDQGQIFVVSKNAIKKLATTTTADFDSSVKSKGIGMLSFK